MTMGLRDEAMAERVRNGQINMMIPRELWQEIRQTALEFREIGEPLEAIRRAVSKRVGHTLNRESFRQFVQRLIDSPPKPQGPAADAEKTTCRKQNRQTTRRR
jgi:hypothetical protein